MSNTLMKPDNTFSSKTGATLVRTGGLGGTAVFAFGLLPFVAMSWSVLGLFGVLMVLGFFLY